MPVSAKPQSMSSVFDKPKSCTDAVAFSFKGSNRERYKEGEKKEFEDEYGSAKSMTEARI